MLEDVKNNLDIDELRLLQIQKTLQLLTDRLSDGLDDEDITLLYVDIVHCMHAHALDLFGDDIGREFLRESFEETFDITDQLNAESLLMQ